MAAEHLLDHYWLLKASKHGMSGEGITFPDILAYERATNCYIAPWEAKGLVMIWIAHSDALEAHRKRNAKRPPKPGKKPPSQRKRVKRHRGR